MPAEQPKRSRVSKQQDDAGRQADRSAQDRASLALSKELFRRPPPRWINPTIQQKIHARSFSRMDVLDNWDLCFNATTSSRRGGIHLARHFIRSNLSNLIHHCCRCHFISDSLSDCELEPDFHPRRARSKEAASSSSRENPL